MHTRFLRTAMICLLASIGTELGTSCASRNRGLVGPTALTMFSWKSSQGQWKFALLPSRSVPEFRGDVERTERRLNELIATQSVSADGTAQLKVLLRRYSGDAHYIEWTDIPGSKYAIPPLALLDQITVLARRQNVRLALNPVLEE
jgi:hypothetical protein